MNDRRTQTTRRQYARAISLPILLSLVGCLAGRVGDSTDGNDTPTIGSDQIRITFHRREGGTSTLTRERVAIQNVSERSIDLSNYVLKYGENRAYSFRDLQLQPDARVLVVSRGAGNGVMKSSPPTYVRDANFDSLVLTDGHESVSLVSPTGTVVVERTWKAT